jgi:CRP-like cAMP-binding protein
MSPESGVEAARLVGWLRGVEVLALASSHSLTLAVERGELLRRPAGAVLLRAGQSADALYVIGVVALHGDEGAIALLGAGHAFGVSSLLYDREAHPATARCLRATALWRLRVSRLADLPLVRHDLEQAALGATTRRLRQVVAQAALGDGD